MIFQEILTDTINNEIKYFIRVVNNMDIRHLSDALILFARHLNCGRIKMAPKSESLAWILQMNRCSS